MRSCWADLTQKALRAAVVVVLFNVLTTTCQVLGTKPMYVSDAHWLIQRAIIHPDAALRLAAASLAALGLPCPKKSSVFGRLCTQ